MSELTNSRVLLLNFSYQPLGTVGIARAVCLTIREKVFVEEYEPERVLHSPTTAYRVPSVIRLRAYVNVHRFRRRDTRNKRLRIYIRDNFVCQYCGVRHAAKDLTLDHIVPRARGGDSSPENLVAACITCNQRKADRTPTEARMPLLTAQHKLRTGLDHIVLCHYAESRPAWRKYLFIETDTVNWERGRARPQ